jgi:hypothetical protein
MEENKLDWKALGLLNGVAPEMEKYTINVFEFALDYMNIRFGYASNGLIFSVILQMIKSEIIDIIEEVSAEGCYDRSKYTCYNEIDCEAQFVSEYCENKLKQLNN